MAISPQTQAATATTAQEWSLSFRVLSDPGNVTAKRWGLVFKLPDYVRPVYDRWGADLRVVNGDDAFELPVPATYVIDKTGRIRWAHVKLDFRRRAEPSRILRALDKLNS